MTAFRVNDAEQLILRASELSHAAKVLYMVGIRPRMDFKTGIVGKVRRISYQTLHEDLEYKPLPGSTRAQQDYSVSAIRALIAELERAGLVRRLPNDHRALFLECLVADREVASKNRNDRGTTDQNDRGTTDRETSNGGGYVSYPQGMNDRPEEGRNDIPPVSGVHSLSVVDLAAARRAPAVDNSSNAAAAASAYAIAVWLRAAEALRIGGAIPMIPADDEHIGRWVCRGVDAVTLERAYALAVAARQRDASMAPIYTGFLDRFVAEAKQSGGGVRTLEDRGRGVGVVALPGWSMEQFRRAVVEAEAVHQEAARMGLVRQSQESFSEFSRRVVAARREGAACEA